LLPNQEEIEKLMQNVKNFASGYFNYFNRRNDTPKHIKEQILHRMLLCAPCAQSSTSKCAHCLCATPALFFAHDKLDALKR